MTYDVRVIGTGPVGFACAIRCAQPGLKTAVVEKDELGGVFLNVGCIPSKAMIAGQPMLAHKGSHEGLIAAAAMAGDKGAAYDPACIPAVIFTDPEIASVGLSAEEAKAAGFDPIEGKFPFAASGRAMSLNETEGWVKVVGDKKTDKLLGDLSSAEISDRTSA